MPALASCTGLTGNNNACLSGDSTCRSAVETPIENANDFNVYDVLEPSSAQSTDPPETYVDYLQSQSVMTAIGAQTTYGECPDTPYNKMVGSGDGKIPNSIRHDAVFVSCTVDANLKYSHTEARSFLEPLSEVVRSGVNVLVWAGDLGKSSIYRLASKWKC